MAWVNQSGTLKGPTGNTGAKGDKGETGSMPARAYRNLRCSATLLVPKNTFTRLTSFVSGVGDESNTGITFSGGICTVERAGIYTITAQIIYPANTTGNIYLSVLAGPTRYRQFKEKSGASTETLSLVVNEKLEAGATISIEAYHTGNSDITLANEPNLIWYQVREN